MMEHFTQLAPEVQAAYISAMSTLFATIVAGISAFLVGRQLISRKKFAEKLHVALCDIEFLLAVEREHCEHHRNKVDKSFKKTMRQRARSLGFYWSGQFAQSGIDKLRDRIPSRDYLKDPE